MIHSRMYSSPGEPKIESDVCELELPQDVGVFDWDFAAERRIGDDHVEKRDRRANTFCYDRARRNHNIIAYCNARQNGDVRSDPDVFSD